ncbi:MAG: nucleotidyl transferase AbiEii/AbiGii toxin family protein [Leptonema sp. (in: Bacteria)]|nr:nucleotidyl transferase AbiEii/AbiGii toxin family protein [Leptonema sp. (in: bacteria)]
MEQIDYKALYILQDKVFDCVFQAEREFYLTGGTCLSRFYLEKRYSDDLDFFSNSSNRFRFAVKNVMNTISNVLAVSMIVDSKDFVRILINQVLQIDFVNDWVPRYKDVIILDNGYIVDSIENILSNKLTAVLGRDNPKDIFDIFLIEKNFKIDWSEILKAAHSKAAFGNNELIIRIQSFPKNLLKNIAIVPGNENFLDDFDEVMEQLVKKIE